MACSPSPATLASVHSRLASLSRRTGSPSGGGRLNGGRKRMVVGGDVELLGVREMIMVIYIALGVQALGLGLLRGDRLAGGGTGDGDFVKAAAVEGDANGVPGAADRERAD